MLGQKEKVSGHLEGSYGSVPEISRKCDWPGTSADQVTRWQVRPPVPCKPPGHREAAVPRIASCSSMAQPGG